MIPPDWNFVFYRTIMLPADQQRRAGRSLHSPNLRGGKLFIVFAAKVDFNQQYARLTAIQSAEYSCRERMQLRTNMRGICVSIGTGRRTRRGGCNKSLDIFALIFRVQLKFSLVVFGLGWFSASSSRPRSIDKRNRYGSSSISETATEISDRPDNDSAARSSR